MDEKIKLRNISWIIGIGILILFVASSLRHELFQSTTFDLGLYDQAPYLISQGKEPIINLLGFHILGDHAAWIYYPIALLYKIYPTVYWLFIVQSFSLGGAAFPVWYLSLQAGLKESQATAVVIAYLLYPVVFNANLFDFHSEVIAVPFLFCAVLAARSQNIWWFCLSIILVLGSKDVLSLTVAAMGVWLILCEKRRLYGAIALVSGIVWFLIVTQVIIPHFSGAEAAAVGRYKYLGDSVLGIAKNLVLRPELILGKIFSLDNFGYLIMLFVPIAWGLSSQSLPPLIGAIPTLILNLLADYQPQKDLLYQYSIPALPFLTLAVISSLAVHKGLLQNKRAIILWSLVAFLSLAKFTHFTGKYLQSLDTWEATREAIAQIQPKGRVYTTSEITPHLSHRELIYATDETTTPVDLNTFEYVLLNVRHPGYLSSGKFATKLVNQLQNNPLFVLKFQKDDIYLFTKK